MASSWFGHMASSFGVVPLTVDRLGCSQEIGFISRSLVGYISRTLVGYISRTLVGYISRTWLAIRLALGLAMWRALET